MGSGSSGRGTGLIALVATGHRAPRWATPFPPRVKLLRGKVHVERFGGTRGDRHCPESSLGPTYPSGRAPSRVPWSTRGRRFRRDRRACTRTREAPRETAPRIDQGGHRSQRWRPRTFVWEPWSRYQRAAVRVPPDHSPSMTRVSTLREAIHVHSASIGGKGMVRQAGGDRHLWRDYRRKTPSISVRVCLQQTSTKSGFQRQICRPLQHQK